MALGVILCAVNAMAADKNPDKTEQAPAFSRQVVVDKAEALSKTPYEAPPADQVPEVLKKLKDRQYQDIRFVKDKALWRKEHLPFQLQFFHPGQIYDRLVSINIVDDGKVVPFPFDKTLFDYGSNHTLPEQIPDKFGFAGFSIYTPLNNPAHFDRVAMFLGASYFRAVAKGQTFGISARGLAVNTALPDGEEFPFFKEFWIEKPTRKSTSLTVHALLDSPSLTGAYTFVIHGGKTTTMDVTATIFLRAKVKKVGLAPLNSMFLLGENTDDRKVHDFRPEVHDSDGLLIKQSNQEWFWRPLDNPSDLEVNDFQAENVLGFGLIQRDLDFHHYEDLNAKFEDRPSLWVEPDGKWGRGHVELVNIPTDKEIHNNIIAYWVPEDALPVGTAQTYRYQLRWYPGRFTHPPLGYVQSTRAGDVDGGREFVIEFNSKALSLLKPPSKIEGVITCGKGAKISRQRVEKNPHTGGWRLTFVVRPDEEPSALEKVLPKRRAPIDLRAFLRLKDTTLTETWNYDYQP